jgi:hypothetical protein
MLNDCFPSASFPWILQAFAMVSLDRGLRATTSTTLGSFSERHGDG